MKNDTALDLLAEYRELAALCDTLNPAQWRIPGAFYDWTPWDEIAHLCYFDETALQAVCDPERFASEAATLNARIAAGAEFSAINDGFMRTVPGAVSGEREFVPLTLLSNRPGGIDIPAGA